jgi:hypothetical protein
MPSHGISYLLMPYHFLHKQGGYANVSSVDIEGHCSDICLMIMEWNKSVLRD